MEEYKNLNWSVRRLHTDAQKEEYFDYNFSDDETDVFYCHLNEIDDFHYRDTMNEESNESNEDLPTDPRTKKIINALLIDCTKKKSSNLCLFENFPVASKLTKQDHVACIKALKSFNQSLTDDDTNNEENNFKNDQEMYFALSNVRTEEKESFLTFIKNYSLTQTERYSFINENYEKFVIDKWRKNIDLMKSIYENKVYNLQTALSLTYATDADLTIAINYKETLKEVGYVPKMKKTFSYKPLTIEFNESFNNLIETTGIHETDYTKHKLNVINDEIAINLATEKDIDIVATISSLYALINTFDDDLDDINIPITIINNNYSDKSTLFIEKPLPKNYLTKCNRNTIGYKYAVRSKVASFKSIDQYSLDKKVFYKIDNTVIEISNKPPSVINYKLETIEDYMNNLKLENNVIEKKVDLPLQTGLNYSYRLWEINESDKTNTENTINLLLRTKQDFCMQHNNKMEFLNLSIKLEYQTEFGGEVMTKSELIKEWCRQYFRPETLTERFRIDVETGILLSKKSLTLQQIELELKRLYKLTSVMLLQRLWSILKFLYKFPINNYIININKTQIINNKILIYTLLDKNINSHGKLLNINEIYKNIQYERKIIEIINWLPIDDIELTILHKRATVMPCAFPPNIKLNNQQQKRKFSEKKSFNEIEKNCYKRKLMKKQELLMNIKEKRLLHKKECKLKKRKNKKIMNNAVEVKEKLETIDYDDKTYDYMKVDENYQIKSHNDVINDVQPSTSFVNDESPDKKITFNDYMKYSGNSISDSD